MTMNVQGRPTQASKSAGEPLATFTGPAPGLVSYTGPTGVTPMYCPAGSVIGVAVVDILYSCSPS